VKDCCQKKDTNNSNPEKEQAKGFWSGLLYGLIPHSFCIAFIVLSIIGATAATVFLRKLLLVPYLFQILIAVSLVFATLSAVVYLKRLGLLSLEGMKRKWRYLLTLYGATVLINLLFFLVVFPNLANLNFSKNQPSVLSQNTAFSSVTLAVDIPCSGHAPLINGEVRKVPGVQNVTFKLPNLFEITYNSQETSPEQILQLEIFKNFKAKIKNN